MTEPALSAVIERAIGAAGLVPDDAEQLDLGLRPVPAETVRPRGRPPGAVNKRSERIAEYLLAKYPDPLEGLLRMGSLGIEEMRAALGCTPMEAFAEKRLCLIAALPFLHKRMPLAVDVSTQSVVHLAIIDGGTDGAGAEDGLTVLGTVVDVPDGTERNQAVTEAPDAPV